MVDATIEKELSSCLGQLPVEKQLQVLDFAKTLALPTIKGVQGKTLLRFAGSIDATDLEAMSQAIADDCERVDADEW
jgi:hypothetical protein